MNENTKKIKTQSLRSLQRNVGWKELKANLKKHDLLKYARLIRKENLDLVKDYEIPHQYLFLTAQN
jgi:hypothetical protein